MNYDKNIVKAKLQEICRNGTAVVFEIAGHYVQLAAAEPGRLYCEAASHHFHSAIDIGLEASFAAMGFHLEEGGNYSRVYPASTEEDFEKIAAELEIIFRDHYHADSAAPFEVNDVE
ncbi:MAG: hypothetical protein JNK43_11135 [Ignavibacteria bacterium]|nr:hypothetical protein [Ignavibacteria bacterium]